MSALTEDDFNNFNKEFNKRVEEKLNSLSIKPATVNGDGVITGLTSTEMDVRSDVYWDLVQEEHDRFIEEMKSKFFELFLDKVNNK